MDVVDLPLEQIIPYARNPRRNEQAIATVAASIQEFGWRQPIVVDEAMVVLAGHTRLEAARKLGFKTAPVHVAKGLTASQARAFRIMDNRSGENAEWDKDLLNLELADLLEADFDLGLTGFTEDEVNALMSSLDAGTGPQEGEDEIPETPEDPVSRVGDLWLLGHHRLLCGDSTVPVFECHDILHPVDNAASDLDEARPVTKRAPVFEGPVADPPSCCQLDLGQTCVKHFCFLSCDLNGRNANSLRVRYEASRRVLLTMPALDSASGLYLLQVAQFLIFERQHIFEAVDHASAELHEARSFASPPPPLKCPRANSPSGSQIDLTEANFSHFRFLSNDLRGRTTTNA